VLNKFSGSIFVVGAGAMAEAFIKGVTTSSAVAPEQVAVMNRSGGERLNFMKTNYGVRAGRWEDAESADLIVVTVKPFDMAQALNQLLPFLHGQPILSFAAGISIDWIRARTNELSPVVRLMPNIPVAVLEGAIAVSFDREITREQSAIAIHLLERLGEVVELDESLMNAATAFSGSGPGFVCFFLEAMEHAATSLGFTPEVARKLLLQTVVGTAQTLRAWNLSPTELRRRVTSPGGTTHAGVQTMQDHGLEEAVQQALQAAADRAAEMGEEHAPGGDVSRAD
jgi:pyrroline-5-carboxylate reductase